MFSKIFNAVGALALAVLLAESGFFGYLLATGKLDGARLELIATMLRGDFQPAGPPPAESQPAVAVGPQPAGVVAAEEVRQLRKREHLEMLAVERAARDLEAQRQLLDQCLRHVVEEQERLADQRAALIAERRQAAELARDEGFRKELDILMGLSPRQAKEHILRTWQKQPADAVRLLGAMDEARARRILEQFRTPEELKVQTDLLERIRSGAAGTGPAGSLPVGTQALSAAPSETTGLTPAAGQSP